MSVCISVCLSVTVKTQERRAKTLCCPSYFFMFCMILENGVHYLTLKEETLSGRNFRKSPKSRNFANLGFANFVSWRKFMEKTIVIFWKSLSSDGNNFREWLGKGNNDHFKSLFFFIPSWKPKFTFLCFPLLLLFFQTWKKLSEFLEKYIFSFNFLPGIDFHKNGPKSRKSQKFLPAKVSVLSSCF